MKSFLIVAAATLTMTLHIGSASAEMSDLEIIMVKTDRNDDMLLSKAEVLEIALQQFAIVDLDGNGILDANEAGEMAADAEFSDNDTDKNGSLSIDEMIEEKLADFSNMDTDGDAFLSLDELTTAYASK